MSDSTSRVLSVVGDAFHLGNEPFRLIGGAIHYPRVPRAAWRDRFAKLIDLGANTLETYCFWNAHEPYEGTFDFGGGLDVTAYVELAGSMGLNVIVRPGPYVCAEWDLGGLPWWLLDVPGLRLRCFNQPYLDRVARYYDELIPRLAPLQSSRGGPIVAMQIENEYGYFGNDTKYLSWLGEAMRARGIDSMLFTSDGSFQEATLQAGSVPGVLRTANFGSKAVDRFAPLRKVQPRGPLVCMEFWVGWFDGWRGEKHSTRDAGECAAELDALLAMPDSHVTIYMFQGGTNFGFSAGGNLSDEFVPFVTSYDYDALLDEAGDVTPKYLACRDVVRKHAKLPPSTRAFAPSAKRAYGEVALTETCALEDALTSIATPVESASPLTMEQLGHGRGFALYRGTVPAYYRGELLAPRGMHDWCHVRLNGKTLATWYRNDPLPAMPLEFEGDGPATLEILVHNVARSNFGHRMDERKGLTDNVLVGPKLHDQRALFGWTQYALPLNDVARVPFKSRHATSGATFYRGTLNVDAPADTYLALPGFEIGCVFVNGFNVGRYWNVGPQRTLFVHASMLRAGANEVVVFDAVGNAGGRVESVDRASIGA